MPVIKVKPRADADGGYGIVVVVPMTGSCPIEDSCGFDGWYYTRELARGMFKFYVKEYPHAVVHLVERVDSEWRRSKRVVAGKDLQIAR